MNRSLAGGLVAGLALAALGVGVALTGDEKAPEAKETLSAVPRLAADVKPLGAEKTLTPEFVALSADAGKTYLVVVEVDAGCPVLVGQLRDGGMVDAGMFCSVAQEFRSTTPRCVWKARAGDDCRRRETLQDGGARVRDFGELNRFAAGEAVGAGCQPVACTVLDKADAEFGDDELLERERGGGR